MTSIGTPPLNASLTGTRPERHTSARPAPATSGGGKRPATPLIGALLTLFVLYALALGFLRPGSPGRNVDLNRLLNSAAAGQVPTARFLDQDARVIGTLVEGGRPVQYWASYPRSDAATNDLLQSLLRARTSVSVDSQSFKALVRFIAQFLLPLLIFADLLALVFLWVQGRGADSGFLSFASVGNKRLGEAEASQANFSNFAGADETVLELTEVRDYLVDPESFSRLGALPPKGVLLVGPPGCGKTLLARAVAGEAQAAFYSISGSNFVESLVGVGAARVRDLFLQAKANAPAIIFIDELDAVGRQRGTGLGGGHDEREQTLNELLVQMDGFSPTSGVAVLAATNRIDILDPALLRPGRFDRRITVERPDLAGRLDILRLHATGKRLADPDGDLPQIARETPGFTGADLAALLNEAALLARRERAESIQRPQLAEALERVLAGPQRKAEVISAEEKRRIACHEAGHAVVAAALGKADLVHKLSVVARGRGVGHLGMLAEDKAVLTRSDMQAQIAVALAGLAAEELVFGEPSTGSELDLERATAIARNMAGRYGMSPEMGRAQVLKRDEEVFLGRDYLAGHEVSQPKLERLDAEVERILAEQEATARSILQSNSTVVESLISQLSAQETLQGSDVKRALSAVRPHVGDPTAPPDSRVP